MKTQINISSSIAVHITFGNPSIKCARFGICQMNLSPKRDRCHGLQSAPGKLIRLKNNHLILQFKRINLSQDVKNRYFMKKFIIEVDTRISGLISRKLGMKEIVLAKGKFPIEIVGELIQIRLQPTRLMNTDNTKIANASTS